MASPVSDEQASDQPGPDSPLVVDLHAAQTHLEIALETLPAWRALLQLEARESVGDWLDVIEADVLRKSLLDELAKDQTYLAWRHITAALGTSATPPTLLRSAVSSPSAAQTKPGATVPLARTTAVADRLPTLAPHAALIAPRDTPAQTPAAEVATAGDANIDIGNEPRTVSTIGRRDVSELDRDRTEHEPDAIVAASGRTTASEEAEVTIRRRRDTQSALVIDPNDRAHGNRQTSSRSKPWVVSTPRVIVIGDGVPRDYDESVPSTDRPPSEFAATTADDEATVTIVAPRRAITHQIAQASSEVGAGTSGAARRRLQEIATRLVRKRDTT